MILYLIRGVSGSGKSTYAKSIGCLALEADMYFVRDGVYTFRQDKIQAAHAWCQQAAKSSMEIGIDVAVANTFSREWELKPYLDMAASSGHVVQILCCTGTFGSTHGVPAEIIAAMRQRWEPIVGEVGVTQLSARI
jgi:predicted kinase